MPDKNTSGESVMGVSIELQSLAKTESTVRTGLQRVRATYCGPFGKSVLVPGDFAAGAWIEFFEKNNKESETIPGRFLPAHRRGWSL